MPFGLAPGRDLKELDDPVELKQDGLEYRLSRDGNRFVLRVTGLPSEPDAAAQIEAVWRGLAWVLVERGIGFDADLNRREATLAEQPFEARYGFEGEFHGVVDGDGPAIFESDKRLMFMRAGAADVVVSSPAVDFLDLLLKGIELTSRAGPADERLATALDLFAAHFYEHTDRARLLTLATAIEVLAEPRMKSAEAQALLDQWDSDLEARISAAQEGTPAFHSLDSLRRELTFRREASIRSRVRHLPGDVLGDSDERVPELSNQAVQTYDARSTLVHTGNLDDGTLQEALENGRAVLRTMLTSLLTADAQDVSR